MSLGFNINPLMKERNRPKGTVDAARDAQKVTEGTLSVVERGRAAG